MVVAKLPFASSTAKDTVGYERAQRCNTDPVQALEKLVKIAQYAKENEPDTLKYFISSSRDESEENALYVVEECVKASSQGTCNG